MNVKPAQTIYQPEDVLPQRAIMLLIDNINHWSNEKVECAVIAGKNGAFVDNNNQIPSWVGLVYMCQAIAALVGIRRKESGKSILLSFVLGSRRIESEAPFFMLNQNLLVEVTNEMRSENGLGVYSCIISCNTKKIKSALIKGVMPEDTSIIINRGLT